MTELRIATFNIRNGKALDRASWWWSRRRSALAAIEALDADVLGLQEAYRFQEYWLDRRLDEHGAVGTGRSRCHFGERCSVLTREDTVKVLEHRTRWFGPTPDRAGSRLPGAQHPRIATTCRVEVVDAGTTFEITNTHLDARSEANRRLSTEQLLSWLDRSVPQVIVGDFNATSADDSVKLLVDNGFRSALAPDGGGTVHRFSGRRDGRQLDHILFDERIELVDAEVSYVQAGSRLPSDHWPVVATVEVRS